MSKVPLDYFVKCARCLQDGDSVPLCFACENNKQLIEMLTTNVAELKQTNETLARDNKLMHHAMYNAVEEMKHYATRIRRPYAPHRRSPTVGKKQ